MKDHLRNTVTDLNTVVIEEEGTTQSKREELRNKIMKEKDLEVMRKITKVQ